MNRAGGRYHRGPGGERPPLLARIPFLYVLRYRGYRLFWLGQLTSMLGWQVMMVTQNWLIYDMTGAPRNLGYLGVVLSGPTILLNLWGGAVADRLDKRHLLLGTVTLSALPILALAALTHTGRIQVWHILAAAFFIGAVTAFDNPARLSLYPLLVRREDLMRAVALNSSAWQGLRIIGPAVGGFLIASAGVALSFGLAGLGFLANTLALLPIRVPSQGATTPGSRAPLLDGVRYIWGNGLFRTLMGLTFATGFFGLSFVMLLPVFARDILGLGSQGYGLLLSTSGLGALLATLVAGSIGRPRGLSHLIPLGACLYGLLLVAFAFSRWTPTSLATIFLAGAVGSFFLIQVMTTLQMLVPDHLRGRVMGLYSMTWSLVTVGAIQGGLLAEFFGAPIAVAIGGLAVTAAGAASWRTTRRWLEHLYPSVQAARAP